MSFLVRSFLRPLASLRETCIVRSMSQTAVNAVNGSSKNATSLLAFAPINIARVLFPVSFRGFITSSQSSAFPNRPQRRPVDPINENIRAKTVRLVDSEGKQVGVMETREALAIARERQLDLVQVGAGQDPVVVKIMDYKKHLFESSTKKKDIKKAQRKSHGTMKIIRIKNHIDDHDLETKARRGAELLDKGHFLKLQLMFKSHYEFFDRIGEDRMDNFLAMMSPDPKNIVAGSRKPGFNSLSVIVKKNTKESLFTPEDLEVYSDDEEEEVEFKEPPKPTKPQKAIKSKAAEPDDGLEEV